jgi:hypothetical protein
VISKKTILCLAGLVFVLFASYADAQERVGRRSAPTGEEQPRTYTENAKRMFDRLAIGGLKDELLMFSDKELNDLNELLRRKDSFVYDPPSEVEILNKQMPVSLAKSNIPLVKLGHTFTTTLIFTDSAGNPWSADMLSDVSNNQVVSVSKKAPHIITVRPMKRAGKTNLPIKLAGHQHPITFLFDISDEEVYFDVNVQLDQLGDHPESRRVLAVSQYAKQGHVSPTFSTSAAKETMFNFMTPEGFTQRRLFDEYRTPVDRRDFVAWTKGDRLYILTPHHSYTPDPVDVATSSDGRYRIFEMPNVPVVTMLKGSQLHYIHVE